MITLFRRGLYFRHIHELKVKTLGGRMKDGKFYMYGNRRNSNVINVHLSQAFPFFDTKKVNKK